MPDLRESRQGRQTIAHGFNRGWHEKNLQVPEGRQKAPISAEFSEGVGKQVPCHFDLGKPHRIFATANHNSCQNPAATNLLLFMKSFFTAVFLLAASAVFAAGPEPLTKLESALAKAKAEGKILFVQMGRENCPNCQALKAMIKKGDLRLSESKFVYADVNCDDPATNKLFSSKFDVKGNQLPFVAIASSDGVKLAGRSGYGTARDFEDLIREAGKQARKLPVAQK
jgi:hypothetical protein